MDERDSADELALGEYRYENGTCSEGHPLNGLGRCQEMERAEPISLPEEPVDPADDVVNP